MAVCRVGVDEAELTIIVSESNQLLFFVDILDDNHLLLLAENTAQSNPLTRIGL